MRLVAILVLAGSACVQMLEQSAPRNTTHVWLDPEDYLPAARRGPVPAARKAARPLVLRHATLLSATGQRLEDATLVVEDGRISALGSSELHAPQGAHEIDVQGRFVTPGLIDAHSHIGVYASPDVAAHADGNEMTSPVTAGVSAAWGYWPQDPAITRALAGGVTVAQILPGSANLIGGRGFIVEMRTGRGIEEVRFPGAPPTLKMACGENPKRVYEKKEGPMTRMGEYAAFRAAFQQAAEYRAKIAMYEAKRTEWERSRSQALSGKGGNAEPAPEPPPRDAKLETLAAVLSDDILPQVHCYRASEMLEMLSIADEFGFSIRSFHHSLEAYKIRDVLAERGVAIATWADWWGFKLEAWDGIPENAALVTESGGRAVIHSDSPIEIQRLNQEAAKAMYAGRAAGVDIGEDQALRWITANPAWVLGIDHMTGTLEVGKRGDIVIWSHHPFSVYARADVVAIAGEVVYDRGAGGRTPTDFELGNSAGGTK